VVTTSLRLGRDGGAVPGRWFDGPVGTDGAPGRVAARAVVVAGLLAVAALALEARRGLDWADLLGVPSVAWAQVLLVGLAAVALLLLLRRLLRIWRTIRPKRRGGEPPVDGIPMPWPWWVVSAVVVVGAVSGAYFLLRYLLDQVPTESGPASETDSGSAAPVEAGDVLPLLLGLLVLVALAALVVRVLSPAEAAADEEEDAAEETGAALAEALDAAGLALERHDDARAAVIAAYREMARVLRREAGHPSDTATELLDRAVAAGLVSRAAAHELTELFRLARFSRHPMPAGARAAAESALARVSAELAGARA
jgi:hypothetical protein